MNDIASPQQESTSSQRIGLAVTSLVLGILSIPFSIFVVGGLAGLLGLLFGVIHLAKRLAYRPMAYWGVGLSVVGVLFSAGFGRLYWKAYHRAMEEWRAGAPEWDAWQGVRAPDFAVTTLDGQTLRLSELRGKRIVLDFWATWCPPCVKEIPHYIELAKDPMAQNVVIIGISSEEESKLRNFVNQHGVNYPIASARDDSLPAPYRNVRAIPTTFFIDRNGVIQTIFEGYRNYDDLREAALAADFNGEVRENGPAASDAPASPDDR